MYVIAGSSASESLLESQTRDTPGLGSHLKIHDMTAGRFSSFWASELRFPICSWPLEEGQPELHYNLGLPNTCKSLSHVQLFATPWTVARQAPLSMGLSRQEYWSGLPRPLQGMFLTQESNPCLLYLLHWQGDSLPLVPPGKPLPSPTKQQLASSKAVKERVC